MRILRDGIALAYEDGGNGAVPVVLVHGWGMNRSVLAPLGESLRTRHRVLAIDLRGFGESDAPNQPYTIASYSDDVAFLLDELGLERAIVAGHSMGGMMALDFAARYPQRTAAAVILEGMVVASDSVLAGLGPMLEEVRSVSYRAYLSKLIAYLTGPHFDANERLRVTAICASCPQRVLVSALEGIIAFNSLAAAAEVECPLLYVGTNTTYADIPHFKEICPQLVTGQLVGCSHYFPLEVPDQLAPMVVRFIRSYVTVGRGERPPELGAE